jgi:hypothetical protein
MIKKLPTHCPSCEERLVVKRLHCTNCETEVEGLYPLPSLSSLLQSDQEFVLHFIKASGSLKEMAKLLGVSYPTVRNKLNDVIEKITALESNQGVES